MAKAGTHHVESALHRVPTLCAFQQSAVVSSLVQYPKQPGTRNGTHAAMVYAMAL